MMPKFAFLRTAICPVCQKEFFPAPMHVYKDERNRSKLVCSYPCRLRSIRLYEEGLKPRGRKPKNKGVIA